MKNLEDKMNLEEFKKDVFIFNMNFGKFKNYYNGIVEMEKTDSQKALQYAVVLSYATVTYTKHEFSMYKRNIDALKSLILRLSLTNSNKISMSK